MQAKSGLRLLGSLIILGSVVAGGVGGASARRAHSSNSPIIIGQITSLTGPFSVYGVMEVQGFHIGLEYATHGTMAINGAPIVVKTLNDAGSTGLPDPAVAVTDAKEAVQNDHAQILQCCASSASAIAVAGEAATFHKILMVAPAADNSLSGINRYTFRTSREDSQDANTGAGFAVQQFGDSYMTLAQDYAFGHGQADIWSKQLDRLHAHNLGKVYFPLTATDFTPYIQQILSGGPKWLFVACAGQQCLGLWKQLDQQGLLARVHVMTGLPNVAAIPAFGPAGNHIGFISVYYSGFAHTAANTFLVKQMQKEFHRQADIFDQDAFAAAQQIVAAVTRTGSTDAAKLIPALEGQTVQGPKGPYTIRKQDHVCLQPMYVAKLVGITPVLLATKTPQDTAPPLQANF
ncbi:MAG TPA: ABC transporter substrate-binding protein [Chloroflexota bacterium]|nr:ABC transporter substrate-binding protein [Chloroflexota bacterium]